jgi:glycine/D-amino acid oxidase-like deaminating enzyme
MTLGTELLREIRRNNLNTEVHVYERLGQVGIGNTEKSIEGVRPYWFTPEEIRFYMASIRAFHDLPAHFGEDAVFKADDPNRVPITSSYRPKGYHYFLRKGEYENALARKELFESEGVHIAFHSRDEANEIDWIRNNFELSCCDTNVKEIIFGYIHVPEAGFVSVGDIVASYRAVFEKLGGRLHLNTEVTGFEITGNQIENIKHRSVAGVKKDEDMDKILVEKKSTDLVVNAAGVWSETLNRWAIGGHLGVTPHRRIVHIVKPPPGYITDHGLVILKKRMVRPDEDKLWLFFSPEDEKAGIQETPPSNDDFDDYFFNFLYPVLCDDRRPFIRDAGHIGLYGSTGSRGWMGHYADTPDERPLIGVPRPDKLENYAVSTGYSGHGVMSSVASALGLTHQLLGMEGEPIVNIPHMYSARRDPTLFKPDDSQL